MPKRDTGPSHPMADYGIARFFKIVKELNASFTVSLRVTHNSERCHTYRIV
jgi:hypothetical protein